EAVATARAIPAPRPPAPAAVRVAPAVEPAPTPRTAPSHADAVPIASATPTGAPAVVEAPRGAFTVVRPGESLREVARRVYGSEEAAEGLWKANRDLIDEAEGPLTPGALLRTP
ncbi:MAG: hypothetical protein U0794_17770, partial [Isosphaeraceae bacterium]